LITCLPMAHYEFNRRNGNFISFKDAIVIGLIILGISYVISTVYTLLSYELILKEKLHQFYSNFGGEYGAMINSEMFSPSRMILSSLGGLLLQIFFMFFLIAFEAQWKIYKKAGKEGWAAIVPVYNIVILLEIVNKPSWWLVLFFIPFVNIIFAIWVTNLLSKRFNKDEGFTFGLMVLPLVFYPLLGMSDAEYVHENQ
jgi:hypothetical protein